MEGDQETLMSIEPISWVYLAGVRGDVEYPSKIGWTRQAPDVRLSELRASRGTLSVVGVPHDQLEVLRCWHGTRALESVLHRHFRSYRHARYREWYHLGEASRAVGMVAGVVDRVSGEPVDPEIAVASGVEGRETDMAFYRRMREQGFTEDQCLLMVVMRSTRSGVDR